MSDINKSDKQESSCNQSSAMIDVDESGLAVLSPLLTFPLAGGTDISGERRTGQDRRVADRRSRAREFSVPE